MEKNFEKINFKSEFKVRPEFHVKLVEKADDEI